MLSGTSSQCVNPRLLARKGANLGCSHGVMVSKSNGESLHLARNCRKLLSQQLLLLGVRFAHLARGSKVSLDVSQTSSLLTSTTATQSTIFNQAAIMYAARISWQALYDHGTAQARHPPVACMCIRFLCQAYMLPTIPHPHLFQDIHATHLSLQASSSSLPTPCWSCSGLRYTTRHAACLQARSVQLSLLSTSWSTSHRYVHQHQ